MIIPFPHNSPLLKTAFEVLQGSREGLLVFTPLIIVSRAFLNMATMQGHAQHTKILTDTVLFFIGIYCLEHLMMMIMSIPAFAGELIANKESVSVDKVPKEFHWFSLTLKISDVIDYLTVFVFHFLSIIYLLIMAVAIMLGGYVVFFATLFQVRKIFTVFIMICTFLSLWPFIWYSLDRTFEHILTVQNNNASAVGAFVALLLLAMMKLAIPAVGFLACLKAPVGLVAAAAVATKTGANAIASATKMGVKVATAPARFAGANEVMSYATRPVANRISSAAKRTAESTKSIAPFAAYKTSQMLKITSRTDTFCDFRSRNMATSKNQSQIKSSFESSSSSENKQSYSSKRSLNHAKSQANEYATTNAEKRHVVRERKHISAESVTVRSARLEKLAEWKEEKNYTKNDGDLI